MDNLLRAEPPLLPLLLWDTPPGLEMILSQEGVPFVRVQDRDLASLRDEDRHTVRRLQREYVELWIGILAGVHSGHGESDLRVRAHACFGLINSTPYSSRGLRGAPADSTVRGILESMAFAALTA